MQPTKIASDSRALPNKCFVINTYSDITLICKWEGELKRGSFSWLQNIV